MTPAVITIVHSKWNKMTPDQRVKVLKADKSMQDPRWKGLLSRMSTSTVENLSGLQKGMLSDDNAITRAILKL